MYDLSVINCFTLYGSMRLYQDEQVLTLAHSELSEESRKQLFMYWDTSLCFGWHCIMIKLILFDTASLDNNLIHNFFFLMWMLWVIITMSYLLIIVLLPLFFCLFFIYCFLFTVFHFFSIYSIHLFILYFL